MSATDSRSELDHSDAIAFSTTHWTVILDAGNSAAPRANEALTKLCQTYWPPLYAFLRRQGYSPQDAEDFAQGFFERFLERDYLRDVDREKGRFRSFLLASLRHFVANEHRDRGTQRRGGKHVHLEFESSGVAESCEAALQSGHSPELLFDRVWAETVMANAARRLRDEFAEAGKSSLYEVIRVWLAKEAKPGDYAATAERLGMTEGALAVAVHRMRQRFHQLVRTEVAHTVQSPADLDDEMRHLLRVLTA